MENRFKDVAEISNTIVFNEEGFDHAVKDFSVDPVSKIQSDSKIDKVASCNFSREDLTKDTKASKDLGDVYTSNLSVENYKGSEKVGLSEIPLTEGCKSNKSNWKRPDLVEKRVIRGL